MPSEKLTDRRVKTVRVPAGGARLELWDIAMPGLGLRVAPDSAQGDGTKTWFVRYRIAGAQRRLKLGVYPALSLAKAHEAARGVFEAVAAGKDPAGERQAEGPGEPKVDTFAHIAEQFVARYVRPNTRPKSAKETERILSTEVKAWAKRPIGSITRRDVIELLDAIVDRGAPVLANRTLAAIRKLFNWAIERDIVAASPCDRVKPPAAESERQRVLTDDEVRLVWQATADMGPAFGPFVRVALLTAQRKGETSAMRWQDVDLGRRVWTIPRGMTKGDREHEVPLSPLAIEVIKAQPRIGDFVFPGRPDKVEGGNDAAPGDTTGKPFNGFSKAKERLDAAVLELRRKEAKARGDDPERVKPLEPWTLHDLRRTAATGMARLGVPRLVISKIENHVEGGVTAIYDRYAYQSEKRDALERWAARVRVVVEPVTQAAAADAPA
ncbi:tyrosine-type recombinase/integrase [Azospirillum sp. ST 5-10]|uniref:tyrosine-type recombinase/integrase n=1 Tax=unclassified Azospirillum TaxID=2630922 RepID=UPI003F4A1D8B